MSCWRGAGWGGGKGAGCSGGENVRNTERVPSVIKTTTLPSTVASTWICLAFFLLLFLSFFL